MKVGISGHQQLPDNALLFIRSGIEQVLRRFTRGFSGVCSLAEGADQLFAEIVLRMGGYLHIIIPCSEYETTFDSGEAVLRFRNLLEEAHQVETLNYARPSEEAFLEAGRRVVESSQLLIAVWDGLEAEGKGGTGDIVRYARDRRADVVVVWPPGVDR